MGSKLKYNTRTTKKEQNLKDRKKGIGEKMKKIVFGITSLTIGGAERVLVDIANQLQEDNITIFTIYAKGDFEKNLNPNIQVKSLYSKQYNDLTKWEKLWIPLKIFLFRKQIYKKTIANCYDIEVAFLEGPITRIFSVKNKKVKKIAWIHNDILQVFGKGIKAKCKKILDKNLYQQYQEIIFVSKDNLEKFKTTYQTNANTRVIYNYINPQNVLEKVKEEVNIHFNKDVPNLVTVARLVEQKAIDRLIKVHAQLIQEQINHHIYVIGDGPLKEKLEEQIRKANVEKTIHLLGKKQNPYPYIRMADYFCLFSYFEGYGMVLEEAKILNKPILITDTAAREAIIDYPNSSIFPNTEERNKRRTRGGIKKQKNFFHASKRI